MFSLIRSGLIGVAWVGAAGVLLCSALQMVRLLVRDNRPD